jgi:hypothetical protein
LRRIIGDGDRPSARLPGLAVAVAALATAGSTHAQVPALAQPAATITFDGIYVGVSAVNNSRENTLSGGRARSEGYAGSRACRDFRRPARLTIHHGEAQANWGQYVLRGQVTPHGRLTMTTGYGQEFEGRIESQGRVTGQLIGYCAYTLTWRKTG